MTTEPKELKSRVAIERIIDLAETRDVRPIDRDHVARLAIAVESLPPVDVVKMATGFGLLAGYHRREAHHLAGVKTMRVRVHDLEPEQWFAFAIRSNLDHGLPLTMAQRKAAARRMLEEGDRRSDRFIAADCGLDHKTVGKLRQPLDDASGGDLPHLDRVGRDGKRYPMSPRPDTPLGEVNGDSPTVDDIEHFANDLDQAARDADRRLRAEAAAFNREHGIPTRTEVERDLRRRSDLMNGGFWLRTLDPLRHATKILNDATGEIGRTGLPRHRAGDVIRAARTLARAAERFNQAASAAAIGQSDTQCPGQMAIELDRSLGGVQRDA